MGCWFPCTLANCNMCKCRITPDEFQVVLAGFGDGTCDECADANGTFILSRFGQAEASCSWSFSSSDALFLGCNADTFFSVILFFVSAGGNYEIEVEVTIRVGVPFEVHRFNDVAIARPALCMDFDGTSVSLASSIDSICDGTSATCEITSL